MLKVIFILVTLAAAVFWLGFAFTGGVIYLVTALIFNFIQMLLFLEFTD